MKKIQKKSMFNEVLYPHTQNSPDTHKSFPRLSQLKSLLLEKNCFKSLRFTSYIYSARVISYTTHPLYILYTVQYKYTLQSEMIKIRRLVLIITSIKHFLRFAYLYSCRYQQPIFSQRLYFELLFPLLSIQEDLQSKRGILFHVWLSEIYSRMPPKKTA